MEASNQDTTYRSDGYHYGHDAYKQLSLHKKQSLRTSQLGQLY